MQNQRNQTALKPSRIFRKLFLSGFVVFSFAAYALHKPSSNTDGGTSSIPSSPNGLVSQLINTPTSPDPAVTTEVLPQDPTPTTSAQIAPTAPEATATDIVPLPSATAPVRRASGLYKDGSYNGPEIDAFYGLVQVQVTVQNGKMANVRFLEYPSDRRTSVRINTIAVPYLQQEAIQAQNANVDIITGATLTSEAFMQSLQSALSQAKN
jgi:uncharacterized protein with FMN-binding domain